MSCPYKQEETNENATKKDTPCYYQEYLQLDKILDANEPMSTLYEGKPVHDEHLFITIHQAYELWFKQILIELNSCIGYLETENLDDKHVLTVVARFNRINQILKLLVEQFTILDTMTPMDFLDFRKYLNPASGFQSVQFRILESRLGLKKESRLKYNKQDFDAVLTDNDKQTINQQTNKSTLFEVLEKWLERCPFVQHSNWHFWEEYQKAAYDFICDEAKSAKKLQQINTENNEKNKNSPKIGIESEFDEVTKLKLQESFATIFNETKYNELRDKGSIKLSHKALQSTLMIMLYRDQPIFQMPYQLIDGVITLDNLLTKWRTAHAQMVHRMIGAKMGTGGSSGYHYLRSAVNYHRVFNDFFNLSTYMVPGSYLPSLPESLQRNLRFIE